MVPSQLRKRRHEQHDQNVQSLLWDLFTCFFGTKNQIFSLPKNERLEPEADDVLEKTISFSTVPFSTSVFSVFGGFSQNGWRPKMIRLTEEILHQAIDSLFHYLQGFIYPRWCRISSINSVFHQI